MFLSSHHLVKALEVLTALAIVCALTRPRWGSAAFAWVEGKFRAIAAHRVRAIAAAGAIPMAVRFIMLLWYPFPQPIVHDEFSYLLQADTFAHGRLTNETPPYWQHFETEYTLLLPTYASQYEPAQGLILAAGQVVFGHPWWGVWLSVGIMCAVFCWALAEVMPTPWALFGALLAALQFGIFGIWMNSYFGGAVSATAGAMVFGALASLRDASRWRWMGVVCASGLGILFATRPFEGVIWSGVVLIYGYVILRRHPGARSALRRELLIPFFAVCCLSGWLLAFYNWRITGKPAVPPYLEYRNVYGTPQPFWWQGPIKIAHFNYPELRDNYLNQRRLYEMRNSIGAMLLAERDRLRDFWRFFIGPLLTPALLFIALLYRDRKIRPWLFISLAFIADKATYHAWFPAQNGPSTILVLLIVVQCWRHLRAWQRRRHFGLAMSRTLMAGLAATVVIGGLGRAAEPALGPAFRHIVPIWESLYPPKRLRDDVTAKLESIPGKHLVFVKYAPGHCFCEEWVFNLADPREQRIVYIRTENAINDVGIARTFSDFDVWLMEPDARPYRLSRLTSMEEVAGIRGDVNEDERKLASK
ncbi:MAG TPA: hypothetical protein VHC90_01235 [Bryobacteraceae bacterium]|nr:hypothetical protein [Bryobacteraceae bacterium]